MTLHPLKEIRINEDVLFTVYWSPRASLSGFVFDGASFLKSRPSNIFALKWRSRYFTMIF